jgi:hypothetical protein
MPSEGWPDAILVAGFAHRRLLADCSRSKTAFVPSGALPKSASEHCFRVVGEKRWTTKNRKITIVRQDRKNLRSATTNCESL